MSDMLSESAIISAVAQQAAQRITRKVVAALQRMNITLSGDDSGLKTTWDEICVQVQYEESFAWEVYDETVRGIVDEYVRELPKHEREALWLQTEEGIDWLYEETEDRDRNPIVEDDIIAYLANKYVYAEAEEWSNARIRSFLERSL